MLTQFYAPVVGGEERAVHGLSTALAARGHEVTIGTLRLDGTPEHDEYDGIRVQRVDSLFGRVTPAFKERDRRHLPPLRDPRVAAGLRRIIAEERPDILHAHNWIVHSVPAGVHGRRPPLLLSLHDYSLRCANKRFLRFGSPCTGPGPAKCLRCGANYYGLVKGSLVAGSLLVTSPLLRRRVDMFLPVSTAVADALALEADGLPYRVVPNVLEEGGDVDHRPVDPGLIAQLPENGFVLFLGDATHDKGAGTLLEAHASIDNAPPLVLIGRPIDVQQDQVPPNVHVLGTWPHASALEAVKRCSLLVSPSLVAETFGMAALEAMAAERPVVASSVGGLPELVVDGETGVLVPPGDPHALGAAIAELMGDPARREALGKAGKARAAMYSAARVVPRLEEVYGTLLQDRNAAAADTESDVHD
jgi:glycosyltransferase involved in cell wall biosynthesis